VPEPVHPVSGAQLTPGRFTDEDGTFERRDDGTLWVLEEDRWILVDESPEESINDWN
jgi:hypothetical protein